MTEYKIDIVRGNFSEISNLIDANVLTKGVDSIAGDDSSVAKICAQKYNVHTLISGEKDFYSDGEVVREFIGGSSYLPKISGTGCMLTAIIGAYAAVGDNQDAIKCALEYVLQASEKAEETAGSIIEFKMNWFKEMELR